MEACIKILTICLPNGLTAAVYGPTSGRDDDRELFRLAQFDDFLLDLCQDVHGGDLYCTNGDGIFAGYWHCLRTCHYAPPGMELTDEQKCKNKAMKSVRECVEWSYARAEALWPLMCQKYHKKLEVNSGRVFSEVRVAYLLTNFKVCCAEGSTMTGERGFRCAPPTL
jgi:DDE superfamily endonuclease